MNGMIAKVRPPAEGARINHVFIMNLLNKTSGLQQNVLGNINPAGLGCVGVKKLRSRRTSALL
jgi:hypothetical protein